MAANRWVEVALRRSRATSRTSSCCRARQDATAVTEVEVAGRRFDVEPGWNRLDVGSARTCDQLRVRITGRDLPDGRHGGPGAIAEIRVPGCT